MSKVDWIWLPHPAHFICSGYCQFRLATVVAGGKYIVSTVGEYQLTRDAEKHTMIGANRLYETMVFQAISAPHKCCSYVADVEKGELDMLPANDPGTAYQNHMVACAKWGA